MHYMYFQKEYAHKTRIKCIKSKGYERNTTCLPYVLGVQLDVLTKLKGLYTCVTVPIYDWCSALTYLQAHVHYKVQF